MVSNHPVSVSLPELVAASRLAKQLNFNAKSIRSAQSGAHLSRLMGRGMEFAETRRYEAGDDIRTIDWRVTARTGKAHTKLFSVEKERQVVCCVDLRRPMFFATQGVFKSVQAATLASYITWNGIHEGNRVGGLIFSDTETFERRPTRGKKGALFFLQELAKQAAYRPENSETPYVGMENALNRLSMLIRPGSLVFVISDFRKPSPKMEEIFIRIAKHSDLMLFQIYDPIEEALPEGYTLPVTNGLKEWEIETFRQKSLEEYRNRFLARKQVLEGLGRHSNIHFRSFSTKHNIFEELRCWKT